MVGTPTLGPTAANGTVTPGSTPPVIGTVTPGSTPPVVGTVTPGSTPPVAGTTLPVVGLPTIGSIPPVPGLPSLGSIPPVVGQIPFVPTLTALTTPPFVGGIPGLPASTSPPVVGGTPTVTRVGGTSTIPTASPAAGGTPTASRTSDVPQNGSVATRSRGTSAPNGPFPLSPVQFEELTNEARAFQSQYASPAPSVAETVVTTSDGLPEGLSEEDRAVVKSIVKGSTSKSSSSGGQLHFDSIDLKELEAEANYFRQRRHPEEGDRQ